MGARCFSFTPLGMGRNITDWKILLQGGLIWETLIEENQEHLIIFF